MCVCVCVCVSLLKAPHVTRERLAHQITAAALHILQLRACGQREDQEDSFEEWCKNQANRQPMFAYWSLVLQLELIVLQLVHSLRTANFDQFLQTLTNLMPWIFALDHVHYAR